MKTVPVFEGVGEKNKFKENVKIEKRTNVYCIVKHFKEEKYLLLNWSKTLWKSLIAGGVEENETSIEAGKREITEETGYLNVKYIREIFDEIHLKIYAPHKDINRYAISNCLLFELIDEKRKEISDSENHTPVWVEKDKVLDYLNLPANKYLWSKYLGKEFDMKEGEIINNVKFSTLKISN